MLSRISSAPRPLAALIIVGLILVILIAVTLLGSRPAPTEPPANRPAVPEGVSARGNLRPVSQARVGTLNGGTVWSISVEAGDRVIGSQEIARIQGPAGTEVLTAPWPGIVTGVLVHDGDTVTPGTIVATVADISRLHVETTDVDEFIVGSISPKQIVTVVVEALDWSEFQGVVRSVALEPQINQDGDEHYPVTIDLTDTTPGLLPGMTVRVYFTEP